MFARLTRIDGLDPQRIDEMTARFEDDKLELLQKTPGYLGLLLMVDRDQGRAIGISYWDSEQTRERAEETGEDVRRLVAAAGGSHEPPAVERYEVRLRM